MEKDFTEILGAPGDNWHIEPSPNRAGSLDFYYPTVFAEPENAPRYARRFIFLEIGARAENWPTLETEIRPFAAEKFPDFFKVSKACKVKVLLAERTFWEKAFVLFRETCTPLNHEKIERLSRHYYDLAMIGRNEAAERAIQDGKLLSAVCEFDQIFFRRSGVDYENAKRGTFRLIPSMEKQNELKKDYDKMSKEMFYGQQSDFNEIITELKALEHRINKV